MRAWGDRPSFGGTRHKTPRHRRLDGVADHRGPDAPGRGVGVAFTSCKKIAERTGRRHRGCGQ